MEKLYEIKYAGIDELLKLAQQDLKLFAENIGTVITNTTLFGIAKIANDCPVDKGLLQSSIAGDLAGAAGVDLKRGRITEGRTKSTTKIDLTKLEGTIGTCVEYALYVEYRDQIKKKPLTNKQRRYLFAIGVLKKGKDGRIVLKRRLSKHGGPGYFRKNIPIIDRFFHEQMQMALLATSLGRSLRKGK